jgi:formiminoglutamate deiminase
MTPAIFAQTALLPRGWAADVRVSLSGAAISAVEAEASPRPGDARVPCLIPGLSNLHSHAFQRGMAGLSERRGPNADSFWTWRDVMYKFALSLTPEEMQAIAQMAYVEMLEQGFTRVGEFHYLHHSGDGPYADPAEMSTRIFAAAEATGINLTHLPVFYAHGDFGGKDPHAGQRRFLHGLGDFSRLIEACRRLLRRPLDRLGIAPHSLRAVTAEELRELVTVHTAGPVHIHISEQMREVNDSVAFSGLRPVEWLLRHQRPDARWCLIHATHLTDDERRGIAASGAVVGLCPITEANLGDGLFPALEFLAEGGRIGVGSDSNVEITAAGEMRLLEYGQRLTKRARNVLAAGEGSTGAALFHACLAGGAQALGAPRPEIAVGAPADLVGLHDLLELPSSGDQVLDRWIFAQGLTPRQVWAAGTQVVRDGRHHRRAAVEQAFRTAMQRVISA